jgi:hypothetical protein
MVRPGANLRPLADGPPRADTSHGPSIEGGGASSRGGRAPRPQPLGRRPSNGAVRGLDVDACQREPGSVRTRSGRQTPRRRASEGPAVGSPGRRRGRRDVIRWRAHRGGCRAARATAQPRFRGTLARRAAAHGRAVRALARAPSSEPTDPRSDRRRSGRAEPPLTRRQTGAMLRTGARLRTPRISWRGKPPWTRASTSIFRGV